MKLTYLRIQASQFPHTCSRLFSFLSCMNSCSILWGNPYAEPNATSGVWGDREVLKIVVHSSYRSYIWKPSTQTITLVLESVNVSIFFLYYNQVIQIHTWMHTNDAWSFLLLVALWPTLFWNRKSLTIVCCSLSFHFNLKKKAQLKWHFMHWQ